MLRPVHAFYPNSENVSRSVTPALIAADKKISIASFRVNATKVPEIGCCHLLDF